MVKNNNNRVALSKTQVRQAYRMFFGCLDVSLTLVVLMSWRSDSLFGLELTNCQGDIGTLLVGMPIGLGIPLGLGFLVLLVSVYPMCYLLSMANQHKMKGKICYILISRVYPYILAMTMPLVLGAAIPMVHALGTLAVRIVGCLKSPVFSPYASGESLLSIQPTRCHGEFAFDLLAAVIYTMTVMPLTLAIIMLLTNPIGVYEAAVVPGSDVSTSRRSSALTPSTAVETVPLPYLQQLVFLLAGPLPVFPLLGDAAEKERRKQDVGESSSRSISNGSGRRRGAGAGGGSGGGPPPARVVLDPLGQCSSVNTTASGKKRTPGVYSMNQVHGRPCTSPLGLLHRRHKQQQRQEARVGSNGSLELPQSQEQKQVDIQLAENVEVMADLGLEMWYPDEEKLILQQVEREVAAGWTFSSSSSDDCESSTDADHRDSLVVGTPEEGLLYQSRRRGEGIGNRPLHSDRNGKQQQQYMSTQAIYSNTSIESGGGESDVLSCLVRDIGSLSAFALRCVAYLVSLPWVFSVCPILLGFHWLGWILGLPYSVTAGTRNETSSGSGATSSSQIEKSFLVSQLLSWRDDNPVGFTRLPVLTEYHFQRVRCVSALSIFIALPFLSLSLDHIAVKTGLALPSTIGDDSAAGALRVGPVHMSRQLQRHCAAHLFVLLNCLSISGVFVGSNKKGNATTSGMERKEEAMDLLMRKRLMKESKGGTPSATAGAATAGGGSGGSHIPMFGVYGKDRLSFDLPAVDNATDYHARERWLLMGILLGMDLVVSVW